MPEPAFEPAPAPESESESGSESDRRALLPTRRSLLSRLRSWDEHDSWREFFETYWRLIFDTARKAGLDEAAASDVVQETIVAVAKAMPDFRYDRRKGSFKAWLLLVTKRRVADALRARYRAREVDRADPEDPAVAAELADMPAGTADLDAVWEAEWNQHLAAAALERVKRRVKPEHFQMFELSVVREWPVRRVAEALGASRMQVYLARHRIRALLKAELVALEARMD